MADMDTAQKRLSALDWDSPFMPGIPIPTASDTAGKRQHGLWTYSGIESSLPAASGRDGFVQAVGLQRSIVATSFLQTSLVK